MKDIFKKEPKGIQIQNLVLGVKLLILLNSRQQRLAYQLINARLISSLNNFMIFFKKNTIIERPVHGLKYRVSPACTLQHPVIPSARRCSAYLTDPRELIWKFWHKWKDRTQSDKETFGLTALSPISSDISAFLITVSQWSRGWPAATVSWRRGWRGSDPGELLLVAKRIFYVGYIWFWNCPS